MPLRAICVCDHCGSEKEWPAVYLKIQPVFGHEVFATLCSLDCLKSFVANWQPPGTAW